MAVQLVVVGADLGDRRAVADHRHDALVLVVEGPPRVAGVIGEDVARRPPTGLEGDGPELRQVAPVVPGDVRHVADRVDLREPIDRQVRLGDQPAAAAGRESELGDELGRLDAARPDHRPGQDLGAVAQPHPIGEDLVDAGRHAQDDADVGELLRRVVVGGVGEGGQDDGPVVDEVDARALRVEVVERPGARR